MYTELKEREEQERRQDKEEFRLEVAEEWIDWMRGGHMQALLDHGADRAELVRWTDLEATEGVIRMTARYRFPDRETFDLFMHAWTKFHLKDAGASASQIRRGLFNACLLLLSMMAWSASTCFLIFA